MKKLVLVLLAGLLMTPLEMYANKHTCKKILSMPHQPRTPSQYLINPGLNITITGNGVTYLNTTVSLSAGQSFTDCLDYLGVGTYILTLSTVDGVIDQYEITVEDD